MQVKAGNKKSVLQAKQLLESKLPVRLPPVDLVCCNVTKEWYSESFYSHAGGYKLKLYHYPGGRLQLYRHYFSCILLESEFPVELPFQLEISVQIVNPNNGGEPYVMKNTRKISKYTEQVSIDFVSRDNFHRYTNDNHQMKFRVVEIKVL